MFSATCKVHAFLSDIQKATELGVSVVQPIAAQRSELKIDDNTEQQTKKVHHWHKIGMAAAQQCGRCVLPLVLPPVSLPMFLQQTARSTQWPPNAALSTLSSLGYPGLGVSPLAGPGATAAATPLFAPHLLPTPASTGTHAIAGRAGPLWEALDPRKPRLSLLLDPSLDASGGTMHHIGLRAFFHAHAARFFERPSDHPPRLRPAATRPVVHLLVGPEGGWTPAEVAAARAAACDTVSLGPRVLRYETAAVVALAAIQSHAGEL